MIERLRAQMAAAANPAKAAGMQAYMKSIMPYHGVNLPAVRSMRQYAWTDPQEIARYVRDYEARLSGLSRREPLKNIG